MLVICIRIRMIRFGCSFLSENEDDAFFVFFTRECFPNVFTSMLTFWMDLHQQLSKRICFAVVVYYAYIYAKISDGFRQSKLGILIIGFEKIIKKRFFFQFVVSWFWVLENNPISGSWIYHTLLKISSKMNHWPVILHQVYKSIGPWY